MARVTSTEVKLRIETSLSDCIVDAFIDDASAWVDDYLTDCGMSAARLKKIEMYLAAHYITLRDPRLRQQAVEDARETYQRDTQVTEYLRQAIAEDECGIIKDRLLDQESTPNVHFQAGVYSPGDP